MAVGARLAVIEASAAVSAGAASAKVSSGSAAAAVPAASAEPALAGVRPGSVRAACAADGADFASTGAEALLAGRAPDGGATRDRSDSDRRQRDRRAGHQARRRAVPGSVAKGGPRGAARDGAPGRAAARVGRRPLPRPAAPATGYRPPIYEPREGDTVEPFSRRRRFIAEHMVFSKTHSPHVGTVAEVNMTRVVRLREQHKASLPSAKVSRLRFCLSLPPPQSARSRNFRA